MNKAQATLEFILAFIMAILLIVLTANVFVWLNRCIVGRQAAYEESRGAAGGSTNETDVGKSDFYTPPKLDVFSSGGVKK